MTQCSGCSLTFPCLVLAECGKCLKRNGVASVIDNAVIDKQPQCSGCGIVYPYLRAVLCGACTSRSETDPSIFEGHSAIASHLAKRVKQFEATASEHRLNQRPQNASLKSAETVKEKVAILKKQAKTERIDITVQLWIYLEGKGTPRKAQLPSLPATFGIQESADHMFDAILSKVEAAYDCCPAYNGENSMERPCFERGRVVFGITKGNTAQSIDQSYLHGTVAELFGHAKSKSLITESDAKSLKIPLRLFVYPESADPNAEVQPNSDSDDGPLVSNSVRKVTSSSTSKMRKRTSTTAFGQNVSPPRSSTGTHSSSSHPRKIQASKSRMSSLQMSSSTSTTNSMYTSAYRRNMPTLTYDAHPFIQTICEVDQLSGELHFIGSTEPRSVLIGKGWQSQVKGGKSSGAYLSKGFTKYAFRGRLDSQNLAIFQCQPCKGYTENMNSGDLRDELRLLGQAQYFIDTFYKRASAFDVKNLPVIRWNFKGAFIGSVLELEAAPNEGEVDERSLIFKDFLAAPLLEINNSETEERKFSGNENVAHNKDPLGRMIDAYVHHTLIDSFGDILLVDVQGVVFKDGDLCLFDPQAHTACGNSGHWDKGKTAIAAYQEQHKCNSICRSLQLDTKNKNKTKESQSRNQGIGSSSKHPLRIGFSS